ncbi:hypothetical protein KIPB_012130 [Kipferlia bialata]|uniref:Uncharacterized protein n=1 Tax=Kipferlia bialata TaxID=797122 RepID=A0A9K3D5T1_9EUKA|nr:hypothetical protein KIPB_012130 [Kipferlia bialata]|eukprot:g12130.t1
MDLGIAALQAVSLIMAIATCIYYFKTPMFITLDKYEKGTRVPPQEYARMGPQWIQMSTTAFSTQMQQMSDAAFAAQMQQQQAWFNRQMGQ